MDIKEYKCPNCAGAVNFDSSAQKMKCPYCDAEFEIADLDDYQKELESHASEGIGWTPGTEALEPWENPELDDLASGACPSCGAELVGDQNSIASVCPCCGNAQIIKRRIAGLLKPDCLIPFQIDKKAAVDALKKCYKGKRLLPDLFKEENRVNSIQGMYVPFWLFDARAVGHIRYRASRTKVWSDVNFTYTKTDYYSVVRDGSMDFEKIPVDASNKMDDTYMDAIEPFDYAQLTDFKTAFLAGYSAEKYDVDADKSKERASARIKTTIEDEFAGSVTGYSSVRAENSHIAVESGKVRYSLFPVWILNTKHKEKNYVFMINGQSGALVGRLPADTAKSWKFRLLFTGIIGALFTLAIQIFRIFF